METLSVVIATYNEEKNITDLIKSVKDIADEIIVVDGSSQDKTADLARELGAKVIVTNNPSIFHINKQKAIDNATKDWVLQLDADERVDKALKDEIIDILKKNDSSINGYWIPRKNFFLGRYLMKGGQYPDYTIRLYRRGKGHLPQKSVHEQATVEGKVGYLTHPLIHFADPSFKRYLIRYNRYTNLMADELRSLKNKNKLSESIKYLFISPVWWFVMSYIRHKGFMDSWQGFVFSFFSSMRFPVSYIKYLVRK